MKRIGLLVLVVVPLVLGQMCGAPAQQETPEPPKPCLTLSEVIAIPPGTATGNAFSGVYRGSSILEESCEQCATNTEPDAYCDPPTIKPGGQFLVTQTDGVLLLTSDSGPEWLAGGVDQDGTFTVGGVIAPTPDPESGMGDVQAGQALILVRGQFIGRRAVLTWTWRMTFTAPHAMGGRRTDLQQISSATWDRIE